MRNTWGDWDYRQVWQELNKDVDTGRYMNTNKRTETRNPTTRMLHLGNIVLMYHYCCWGLFVSTRGIILFLVSQPHCWAACEWSDILYWYKSHIHNQLFQLRLVFSPKVSLASPKPDLDVNRSCCAALEKIFLWFSFRFFAECPS